MWPRQEYRDNKTVWVHSLTNDLQPMHKLSRCLTVVASSTRGFCVLSGPPVMLLLAWGGKTEKTSACKFCIWAPPNLWTYLWFISTITHLVFHFLSCCAFFLQCRVFVQVLALTGMSACADHNEVVLSPAVLLPNPQERTDMLAQMFSCQLQHRCSIHQQ